MTTVVIVWNVEGGGGKIPLCGWGWELVLWPILSPTGVLQQTAIVWRGNCGRRCWDRSPPCGPGSLQPLLLCDVHRYGEGQTITHGCGAAAPLGEYWGWWHERGEERRLWRPPWGAPVCQTLCFAPWRCKAPWQALSQASQACSPYCS